jgi:hypothetical protein
MTILRHAGQRRMLTAAETDADLRPAAQLEQTPTRQPAVTQAPIGTRITPAVVLALLAVRAVRDVFSPKDRR